MADENKTSALLRRHQQLKRWEDSDTNRESNRVQDRPKKVNFQDGCVFLAACSSGDKDEVLKLIERGADINTANVDGLTALHQACIDDNLDMVEFLVQHNADVDVCDNEGWTPLHATASCGFIDIAQYLINTSAFIAAVNNDGDLPIDICEDKKMERLLQEEMNSQGVDAEAARREEEDMMLSDANQWLNSKNGVQENPHPKTGATALHVAAAKGYIKVIHLLLSTSSLLIQAKINVNIKDFDGWTPLHAAAHWGQDKACKILAENFCDMDMKNNGGQTAFDVADSDLLPLLEELKKKQAMLKDKVASHRDKDIIQTKGIPQIKRRTSVTRMSVDQKQNVVLRTLEQERHDLDKANIFKKKDEDSKKSSSSSASDESSSESETEHQNEINQNTTVTHTIEDNGALASIDTTVSQNEILCDEVFEEFVPEIIPEEGAEDDADSSQTNDNVTVTFDVAATITTSSTVSATATIDTADLETPESESVDDQEDQDKARPRRPFSSTSGVSAGGVFQTDAPPATTKTVTLTGVNTGVNNERSYEPPKRDEETETQRKARAKRARETRRSTQGVTLEEIAMAEKVLKLTREAEEKENKEKDTTKDSDKNESTRERLSSSDNNIKDASQDSSKSEEVTLRPRRPWEERTQGSTQASYRRSRDQDLSTSSTPNIYSYDTLQKEKEKEKDKDSDKRESSALKARRARRERRSTGVIDYKGEEDSKPKEENETDDNRGVNSRVSSSGTIRCGSTSDIAPSSTDRQSRTDRPSSYIGLSKSTPSLESLDYKKLYEVEKEDSNRLKKELENIKKDLAITRAEMEKLRRSHETISAESNQEKREKRALERRLSELESTVVHFEKLKADNAKLKEENRALARVISKLSR